MALIQPIIPGNSRVKKLEKFYLKKRQLFLAITNITGPQVLTDPSRGLGLLSKLEQLVITQSINVSF